jgi:hypothetical protein
MATRTNRATKATPAKRTPKTTTKTATKKAAAKKPARLSTDSDVIPRNPAQLKQLIKITRDRRWRAERRGDDELAYEMNKKLEALTGKPFTPELPAKRTSKRATTAKKAPARRTTAKR